jgi:hypothetical protein
MTDPPQATGSSRGPCRLVRAIQKALDRGAAVVTIPPGVYQIGRMLWIGSNVTLPADSQAAIRL